MSNLETYRYHGFLAGYCAETGRNLGFVIPANDGEAMDMFNIGFEAGYRFGHSGVNGLVETVIADKMSRFDGESTAKRNAAAGGSLPVNRRSVASICGPS